MAETTKRIAFFMRFLGGGGVERITLLLAQCFIENGIEVDLVLSNADGPHISKVPSMVRIIDLRSPRVVMSLPYLIRYLQTEKPLALISVGHFTDEVAVLAKVFSKTSVRVILAVHNHLSIALKHETRIFRRFLIPLFVKFLYPRADGIIAVSKGVAENLSLTMGIPLKSIQVIYNPVVTSELLVKAQVAVEHPWFSSSEIPVVLGVGKLEAQKDFPTLIRAFAKVRQSCQARLVILGWGPAHSQLVALVSELGLDDDVALIGYVDNPYAFMRQSAVFVLSSAWEGLPTVLIEAMAVGTPVVSTNCESGPEEILDYGKYGSLTPVGDSDSLAKAILKVLTGEFNQVDPVWLNQFTAAEATQKYLNLLGLDLTAKDETYLKRDNEVSTDQRVASRIQ